MTSNKFKIIDLFSFSEPYEKELLLLKLKLGSAYIHEWVLVENDFTLQGVYKGYHAETVLNSDQRFEPYKDRIKIFQCSYRPEAAVIDDHFTFKVEFYQRDFPIPYLSSHHSDAYVIVSDTDECVDFTTAKRIKELEKKIAGMDEILALPTKRYWFDFDNEYKIILATPLLRVRSINEKNIPPSKARIENRKPITERWKNYIVFEYSHCFAKSDLARKFETFTHTGFTVEDMEIALLCNHRPLLSAAHQNLQMNEKFLFEQVRLNSFNAPALVIRDLNILKTNIVSPNYKQNRKLHYADIFTFKRQLVYKLKLFAKNILRMNSVG